jgi:hypothetical protein
MKKITLLLLTVFLSPAINAQNWAPQGAEWYFVFNYQSPMFYNVGVNTVRFEGTDTLNGTVCKQFTAHYVGNMNTGVQIEPTSLYLGSYITFESNNVLFVKNLSNGYDTVLNFNANPGDTWLAPLYHEDCIFNRNIITIVDTGHVTLNGEFMQAFDFGQGLFPVKWYFPFPQTCSYDEMGYGRFSCYKDDNFPLFSPDGDHTCNLVSIDVHTVNETHVKLYPNPNSGVFTVNLKEKSHLSIFSNIGSLMFCENFESGQQSIILPQIEAGVYLIKMENQSGRFFSKFIKH